MDQAGGRTGQKWTRPDVDQTGSGSGRRSAMAEVDKAGGRPDRKWDRPEMDQTPRLAVGGWVI
jgi:hypothetical protein